MLPIRALQPLCPGQAPSPRAVATRGPQAVDTLWLSPWLVTRVLSEQMWQPRKRHRHHTGLSWGWPGLGKAEPSQQAPVSWREALGHCSGHAWHWDGNPGFDRSRG